MVPGNFDTMDGFLIRLLVPVYILISLSLVISHAKAVEPPRSRNERELSDMKSKIKMFINPFEVEFYPGDTISVSCRAKGGSKIKETPFISFHLQVDEYTNMPLSSGDPGYLIQAVPTEYLKGDHRVKKILTIGKLAWQTLDYGPNLYYCKAIDMEGNMNTEFFNVIKMPTHRPRDIRRNRRYSRHYSQQDLTVVLT